MRYNILRRLINKDVINISESMLAATKHRPSISLHKFSKRGKPFIVTVNAAEKILQCLATRGALNRVIVEANPGVGVLTSVLLKAGAVDIRVLEYRSKWKTKLEDLRLKYPMKLQVFNCNLRQLDGLTITTKQNTSSDFILKDVPKKEWSSKELPGSLICTFNAKEDYKTIFHLLYNCQTQHGLFSWGRFDMVMICREQIAQKLIATAGSKFYGRMAVTSQLNCHIEPLIKLSSVDISVDEKPHQKEDGYYEVLRLTPKINQPFVRYNTFSSEMLQTIMVTKNKKLCNSLRNYHPNVKELLQKLSISVNKQVKNTSPDELLQIINECCKIRDLPNEHDL